jgi:hypothetical protein
LTADDPFRGQTIRNPKSASLYKASPLGRKTGLSEIDFEHSSHDLNRPEAKRFGVKLTNLNIPKMNLVDIVIDLLEAENLKSKNLTDEYATLMPTYVAAVVHCPEDKTKGINELDRISRQ